MFSPSNLTDIDAALQARSSISDLYIRHLISISRRLRILIPIPIPNPRPVILIIGEEYSGKTALISHLANRNLQSESMCINLYIPHHREIDSFTEHLIETFPGIYKCFHDNGFPMSHLNVVAFNASAPEMQASLSRINTPDMTGSISAARISATGKSVYYSCRASQNLNKQLSKEPKASPKAPSKHSVAGGNLSSSASLYNSLDKLNRLATGSLQTYMTCSNGYQQTISPTCPFIFIEIPFFYQYAMARTGSRGMLSSLSRSKSKTKHSSLTSSLSKTELRVYENTIKALFHQADRILFTTGCDIDAKSEGFSAGNSSLLYYIGSIDDLFRKTTVLITKTDRIVEKQACINVIQECASSLAILSPYRRFKINLICMPRFLEIQHAKRYAETLRLKQEICTTMDTLDTQAKALVDTARILTEVAKLDETLRSKALRVGDSMFISTSVASANNLPPATRLDLGAPSLNLSADEHERFVSESQIVPPEPQHANTNTAQKASYNLSLINSLQQSNVVDTLQTSQLVIVEMAGKLLSQCGTMMRLANPAAYDVQDTAQDPIQRSLVSLGLKPHVSAVVSLKDSSLRIGQLLASTEELHMSLLNSVITDNTVIITSCRAVIVSILTRLEYNIREVNKIKRRNICLTLLRILLVILAILLAFLLASSMQIFGTSFLQTRCYVHHLERHKDFNGGRFEGTISEIIVCAVLYEVGVLGLRRLMESIVTMVCLWSLVPLLVVIVILLDAFYSSRPLQRDELSALKADANKILRPMLALLDDLLDEDKEDEGDV